MEKLETLEKATRELRENGCTEEWCAYQLSRHLHLDAWPIDLEFVRSGRNGKDVERAKCERIVDAAKAVVSAADACDREAERHPSSRSSAPVVRAINAMKRLRDAIEAGEHIAKEGT